MKKKAPPRFVNAHADLIGLNWCMVVADKQTGVQYLTFGDGHGGIGAVTPLLDREGRLLLASLPMGEK